MSMENENKSDIKQGLKANFYLVSNMLMTKIFDRLQKRQDFLGFAAPGPGQPQEFGNDFGPWLRRCEKETLRATLRQTTSGSFPL